MQQSQFDWGENTSVTNNAIGIAVDAADEISPLWSTRVYRKLIEFVNGLNGVGFLTEEFIEYCEANNLPSPPERRAYGGIIKKAVHSGLIRATGEYRPMKNVKSHMNPKRVWIKSY